MGCWSEWEVGMRGGWYEGVSCDRVVGMSGRLV